MRLSGYQLILEDAAAAERFLHELGITDTTPVAKGYFKAIPGGPGEVGFYQNEHFTAAVGLQLVSQLPFFILQVESRDLHADTLRAISAGATVLGPIKANPWGARSSYLVCPGGFGLDLYQWN